jgi:predicted negative regulator of RcsB-dependent stress response
MIHRIVLVVFTALVIAGVSAHADIVVVRGKEAPVKGTVKSEDAKSVVVSVVEKKMATTLTIPSGDVIDMTHDAISPTTLEAGYKNARTAEKDSETDDASVRKAKLGVAIKAYEETHKKMAKDSPAQKLAARHIQYKIAFLMVRQAEDQLGKDQAARQLEKFKDDHPNSWQIHSVMPLLAQLQLESNDTDKAAKTFEEMSNMTALSVDMRREAELKVVEVYVRGKKIEKANEKLDALEKKAAGNAVFTARVKLARVDVLVGQKQTDKAVPILQEIVKATSDKQIKAMAHNKLGEALFDAKKYNEALWEFLWVDAVFNQDRDQHAKALFFLWKTFGELNNVERANECRDMLLNDRQFLGTEYQRKAAELK